MLSQEEIDALVNQLSAQVRRRSSARRPQGQVVRLPLQQAAREVHSNQLQTLRTLHDNFTRLLNNSLSVYLRTRVEATIVSIEQISYGDFIASIGIPSILCDLLDGSAGRLRASCKST